MCHSLVRSLHQLCTWVVVQGDMFHRTGSMKKGTKVFGNQRQMYKNLEDQGHDNIHLLCSKLGSVVTEQMMLLLVQ